ncbi:gliding motility-associated C-terminal domain-containing protein [Chitinophaga sp. YR573]|nr:gliding motility-associated C-terminal domain-containing protein [Chitinophaga sp. YR573]
MLLLCSAISVSAADYHVEITNHANTNESLAGGSYTITVTGTGTGTDTITVNLATSGTAVVGAHYQAFPLTIKIPVTAGSGSITFPVVPINNRIVEPYADVVLAIQSATAKSSATVDFEPAPTTLRIYDDDSLDARVSFTGSTNGTEGGPNATVTASLSSDYIAGHTIEIVAIAKLNSTANYGDYDGPSFRLDSGQHSVVAEIGILDDKIKEDSEFLYFEIVRAIGGDVEYNYEVYPYGYGPIYIYDNNDTIAPVRGAEISIYYVGSPRERNPTVDGAIYLQTNRVGEAAVNEPITVKIRMDGNATEGVDYLPLDSVVIPPTELGSSSIIVPVRVIDDNIIEGDEYIQPYLVSASTPSGDSITVSNYYAPTRVPLYDDDIDNRNITISGKTNGKEGGAPAGFTLSYPDSLVSAEDVHVNYHVIPAGTTARKGVDYTISPVVIPAGQHSATIPINIINDNQFEFTEFLSLQIDEGLGDSLHYPVGPDTAIIVSIEDNDRLFTPCPPDSNRLDIPNVFTPNGDGRNDLFVIRGLENYPNSKLSVFNLLRGGALVYRSENYSNNWDGRGASPGLYSYILEVKEQGRTKIYKGKLVIIK